MQQKKQAVLHVLTVFAMLLSLIGILPASATVTPLQAVPRESIARTESDSVGSISNQSDNPAVAKTPASSESHGLSSKPVGPFVSAPIAPGSFDGDLRSLPAEMLRGRPGQVIPEEIPNRETVNPKGYDQGRLAPDPVAQRDAGSGDMPAPLLTFEALNNQDNFALYGGRVNPPDTNGAVGPNHYIQLVNLVWAVYDKTGTRLFGPAKLSTIFAAAPTGTPCDSTDQGDPVALYDSGANRWILSQFGFTSTATLIPKYECIAVSKGPNPVTDGWWTYAIPAPGDQFNDYPKLSVWPDAYYYTARMFPGSENFFLSAFALDRSAMLAGRPARYVRFDLPGIYDSPLASNWRGEAPPAGTPNVIALADDVTDSVVMWQFRVNWADPASSTLSAEQPVAVAPFATACPTTRDCVPFQSSTPTTLLDALSPRLMFNLEYRRIGSTESLWANHTITESGRTVMRWYEFRYNRAGSIITPTLYQQGTYAPSDGIWRWMGSLSADKDGNMALGYSASSPSIDPQIRYAGRLVTDTLGLLAQGEVTMTVGTGHPTTTNSRWGDYSAMTVDPVDDCTFWYTQEYYTMTGTITDTRPWTTRVGSFKYPSCTPLAAVGFITGTVYDATSLALLPNMPVEAVDAAQNRMYAGSTNASGVYTLTVLPGTYAVSGGPLPTIGYPIKGTVSGVVVTSSLTAVANIPLNGAPYLAEGSRTYNDSAQGNGNGYPEPGEKNILLTEVLSNTGVTTATNIVATLASLTSGFTVVTGTANYPDIAAGNAATNLTPFGLSIDGGLVCGTVGSFRKVVVSTQGTFTIPFTLRLGISPGYTCTFPVPNLVINNVTFNDTGGNSNGNGYIEPGENSINLSVTLGNTGLINIGPATNVSGTLVALTPGVTLTTNSSAYPNIAGNGTGINVTPFNFAVDSSLVCGAALDFGMSAISNEGTFNRTFRLATGRPTDAPTLVLADNVEAGAGTWITSTNIPGVGFTITTEDSHSPTHSWTDSPGGQYPNGLDTALTSPVHDFTTYDTVKVTFWHTYATEAGFDYGQVEYSTDGGASWQVAAAYDGTLATWTQATVDLSAGLAHESNARIRFRFVADTGVSADGWHLDDILISGQQRTCPQTAISFSATPTTTFVNNLVNITATVTGVFNRPSSNTLVTFNTGKFSAVLSGLNETPPVTTTSGTGKIDFTYDPATMMLSYSGSVSGLSANVSAAHIHTGTAGTPGGILVALSYVTTTNGATFSGSLTLPPTSLAAFLSGGHYVNVHTSANPGGEVRGQILDGNLTSMLSGLNEVGPVATNSTGALIFMFNPATNQLMYHGSVAGLNGNVVAAHIHTGTVGVNGPILVPLSYITTTNGATFSGSVTVPQGSVNALLSGGHYVNVHTSANPGGEVRGQIMVGWLGMTDATGNVYTHYTSAMPSSVHLQAYTGSVNAQTLVTFLQRVFLPLIRR